MPRFDLPLMRWGAFLLLAGIITGAFVMAFRIPNLGLSAHLIGMGDGVLLMVLGLVWPHLELSRWWLAAGRYLAVISFCGIWFALTLAAAVGAGGVAPLAGGRASAGPLWDGIATALVAVTSLGALVATVILVAGLWRLRAPAVSQPRA